ncbi:hypothetical protein HD554DRAFT_2310688 [Boletus coccyginus]|nr:hypothetical protein HD554DRAFT_2310688 [Boletus coccyginus]
MARGSGKYIPTHTPPSNSLPLGQGSSRPSAVVVGTLGENARPSGFWVAASSRDIVLDNDGITVSRTSRSENAKKEDETGTSAGAAQPRLTRTERRKFYEERAVQKQDGTAGASGQHLVLGQNEIAASRTPCGENAKKEDAASARAGAAQPQLTRTERRKIYRERAAQKQGGTAGASSKDLVLQNEIAASRTFRGENAKKEDAASARPGAAQPQLTRTERREFQKRRAAQKQGGAVISDERCAAVDMVQDFFSMLVAGASSQDLVFNQNGIVVLRAPRGENAKKENLAGTTAGTAQPKLSRTEQRELKKKQAAQKKAQEKGIHEDEDEDADLINLISYDHDLVLNQNEIAESKASRSENAGTRAGAAQWRLRRTERRKFYKKRAAWKRDGTGRGFGRYLVLDQNGIAVWRAPRGKNGKKGNASGTRGGTAQAQPTRTERREQQTVQKQGINENEGAGFFSLNNVKKKPDLRPRESTRKERKAKEAKEHHLKLHRAGKTDEAKADLARLKIVKEARETAQAKRKAEAEVKAAEIEAKKATMSKKRV